MLLTHFSKETNIKTCGSVPGPERVWGAECIATTCNGEALQPQACLAKPSPISTGNRVEGKDFRHAVPRCWLAQREADTFLPR